MKAYNLLFATALMATMASPAFADDTTTPPAHNAASETQRDVNQQERIENGLKSGDLNTREAAHLEQGENRIDQVESHDMKDGTLSPEEKARIQSMQNRESDAIKNQKTDAQNGNPGSKSSERMQADVQRDANQETRINEGVKNGTLTNRETGKLEQGEARNDRVQARAGANGNVNRWEQRRAQRSENNKSRGIFRKKHNWRNRHTATPAATTTTTTN